MLRLLSSLSFGAPSAEKAPPENITFPATFAFGSATAAYQVEGAYQEGGRGLSIWDAFTHSPGKVRTGETGDIAADHYHRFKSDVRLMSQMKLKYYRFSIAWSRILPNGYGAVNEEGVRFYSQLIDELTAERRELSKPQSFLARTKQHRPQYSHGAGPSALLTKAGFPPS